MSLSIIWLLSNCVNNYPHICCLFFFSTSIFTLGPASIVNNADIRLLGIREQAYITFCTRYVNGGVDPRFVACIRKPFSSITSQDV